MSIEVRHGLTVAADLVLRQLDASALGDAAVLIDRLIPLYQSITANAIEFAFGEEPESPRS